MARLLALAGLVATCGVASAQTSEGSTERLGLRLKLGYQFGTSFPLKQNDRTGRLEGPEIALDVPVFRQNDLSFFLTPSITLGGRLRSGSDIDGTVYRFILNAEKQLNPSGFYGRLGIGYGHTQERSGVDVFRDSNDLVGSISFGTPIGGAPRAVSRIATPGIEATAYISRQRQLMGFVVGFTFSF